MDLTKFIMSFFIIAIHVALFSDVNEWLYFTFVQIVCRLAVPFFAICTGYYTVGIIYSEKDEITGKKYKQVFRNWIKLIRLYTFWTIAYLLYSIPQWIKTGWFSFHAFLDYGVAAVRSGSYYHFWYLLGVIYAYPLLFLCVLVFPWKLSITLAVLLHFTNALLYGYNICLSSWGLLRYASFSPDSALYNAFFCILPYLLVGAYIKKGKVPERKQSVRFLIISLFCLCVEAFFLRKFGQVRYSFILCTLPVAFFLFSIVLSCNNIKENNVITKLGKISIIIYCIHPMFVELFRQRINSSILLFFVVSTLSTISGFLFEYSRSIIK